MPLVVGMLEAWGVGTLVWVGWRQWLMKEREPGCGERAEPGCGERDMGMGMDTRP